MANPTKPVKPPPLKVKSRPQTLPISADEAGAGPAQMLNTPPSTVAPMSQMSQAEKDAANAKAELLKTPSVLKGTIEQREAAALEAGRALRTQPGNQPRTASIPPEAAGAAPESQKKTEPVTDEPPGGFRNEPASRVIKKTVPWLDKSDDVLEPSDASVRTQTDYERADDDLFYRSLLYIFELIVPASTGVTDSLLFPLILNPEGIFMNEPFTTLVTGGGDGGVFVEESGVLARPLRIVGTTGFAPKEQIIGQGASAHEKLQNWSLPRGRGKARALKLSGQRHFQFLQDRVFRTYDALKKNPITSADTRLIFHNLKDQESWYVAPVSFDMKRVVQRRFLYQYDIKLLAIARYITKSYMIDALSNGLPRRRPAPPPLGRLNAALKTLDASTSPSFFESIGDAINNAARTTDALRSRVVAEFNALVQPIRTTLAWVNTAVNTVTNIARAATDLGHAVAEFVEGAARFIARPFRVCADMLRGISAVLTRLVSLPAYIADELRQSLRVLSDSVRAFGPHKDKFAPPAGSHAQILEQLRSRRASVSSARLSDADASPTRTVRGLKNGTEPQRGDLEGSQSDPTPDRVEYQSLIEHRIKDTDTLEHLALQFGCSARDIAIANDLIAPFLSRTPIPRTAQPGTLIVIPSIAPDPLVLSGVRGVYPSLPDVPFRERRLGRDLKLVGGDLVIDPKTGGTDVQTVAGVDNLKQALVTRLTTERGTLVSAPELGYRQIVATGISIADSEIIRLRLREAVEQDPRVEAVTRLDLSTSATLDVIDAALEVRVIQIDDAVSTSAAVRG